jgi:hypothetical protein
VEEVIGPESRPGTFLIVPVVREMVAKERRDG